MIWISARRCLRASSRRNPLILPSRSMTQPSGIGCMLLAMAPSTGRTIMLRVLWLSAGGTWAISCSIAQRKKCELRCGKSTEGQAHIRTKFTPHGNLQMTSNPATLSLSKKEEKKSLAEVLLKASMYMIPPVSTTVTHAPSDGLTKGCGSILSSWR